MHGLSVCKTKKGTEPNVIVAPSLKLLGVYMSRKPLASMHRGLVSEIVYVLPKAWLKAMHGGCSILCRPSLIIDNS